MGTLFQQPVFQTYALCAALTIILLYGIGFFTAATRAARKAVVNPEDVKVNAGASVVEHEHPDVARLKRAHINLIENALPFFAIGLLYVHTDPSLLMARILFFGFVGARLLHTIFYVAAKQPFRTLSFAIGAIINIVMVVQVIRAAI